MTAEIELKLAIDPAAAAATAAALFRHPAVTAARRGRVRKARLVSTYYDTPDWRLAGAGIALRLRREGAHWRQTVKGPPLAQAGGALHARGEYEWPVAGRRLDPVRLATTPWRRQLGHALARLAPRFVTDFERQSLALAFSDGTRATLCLDRGVIRAARGTSRGGKAAAQVPIAEIEIELATGSPERLFELAAALAADLPLAVATANKAGRGQALLEGDPDGWRLPVRAQPVALADELPAAEALRAIALECLHQVAANGAGLVHDDDPEWVHQMRVGTRRLRACLALARRFVPAGRLLPLLAEIKWLAGILGAARDWDVLATETLPAATAGCAADPVAAASARRLAARVARRRRSARTAARAAVGSKRFQQLVLAAGSLCALPGFGEGATGDDAAPLRIHGFARRVLRRRHRRLVRQAKLAAGGGVEARHALRIAAKKLRYAAEFFAPLFHRRRARAYATALAGLQDELGRGNDAATAARLAVQVRERGDGEAAAALDAWLAAAAARLETGIARAWKRFARAGRFWRAS